MGRCGDAGPFAHLDPEGRTADKDMVKRLLVVPAIALLAACSHPTVQPGPTMTVTKTVHIQDPGQSSFTKGWRTGVRYAGNRLYGGPVAFGQWRYEYRMCIRMAKYGPPPP